MQNKSPDVPKKPFDVAIHKIGFEDEAPQAAYESVLREVTQAFDKAAHGDDVSLDMWLQESGMEDFIDIELHASFGDAAPELIQAMHTEIAKHARDHRH